MICAQAGQDSYIHNECKHSHKQTKLLIKIIRINFILFLIISSTQTLTVIRADIFMEIHVLPLGNEPQHHLGCCCCWHKSQPYVRHRVVENPIFVYNRSGPNKRFEKRIRSFVFIKCSLLACENESANGKLMFYGGIEVSLFQLVEIIKLQFSCSHCSCVYAFA